MNSLICKFHRNDCIRVRFSLIELVPFRFAMNAITFTFADKCNLSHQRSRFQLYHGSVVRTFPSTKFTAQPICVSISLVMYAARGGSTVCFLLRDIPKARFIGGLFTAVARRESGASEACIHCARFAQTIPRCCLNRFGPFALACAAVYERSLDVILVTNSDSPSRSSFFLLHSASSSVFFFFFGCRHRRRRRCFVVFLRLAYQYLPLNI